MSTLRNSILVGVIVMLIGWTYKDDIIGVPPAMLDVIFDSYRSIVHADIPSLKVAIGYNTNLDLIVNINQLTNQLGVKNLPDLAEMDNVPSLKSIQTDEEFLLLMAYYMQKGSAVERFIDNPQLCTKINEAAMSVKNHQISIGGNAALMANKLVSIGASVLLSGNIGSELTRLLPMERITPVVPKGSVHDEIHLIIEYGKGEEWHGLVSPRANRVIVHCDSSNSKIESMKIFHEAFSDFKPDRSIITGFHLLEGESPNFRTQKLNEVITYLVEETTPTHLELASIADLNFLQELGILLLPEVESLGLNEQELGYLSTILKKGTSKISNSNVQDIFRDPNVSSIVDALELVLSKSEKLTRIHFHCLKFHIVAKKASSNWGNSTVSVAAGSFVASAQSCEIMGPEMPKDLFTLEFDDETWGDMEPIPLDPNHPVFTFSIKNIDYALAPTLICKSPKKTVGLGDAVSSMGLYFHQLK